ncbi:MAG: hypothetical protein ACKVW3_05325 [Phycisphaerales bacterium]
MLRGRCHPAALLVAAAVGIIACTAVEAQVDAPAAIDSPDAAVRATAAQRLVAGVEASDRRAVIDALALGAPVRLSILAAISQAWPPPRDLWPRLSEMAASWPDDPAEAEALARAVAAYRTPEAVEILIARLEAVPSTDATRAAFVGLVQMSGRDDFGLWSQAWRQWLAEGRGLSESAWHDRLAQGVSKRAEALDREKHSLARSLAENTRRLYFLLPTAPDDERAKVLAQALREPVDELRNLGFEIVERELAAGKSLAIVVASAITDAVGSTQARVRARAARVLGQAMTPEAALRVAAALEIESDPDAASGLLFAAARWPLPTMLAPAMAWLEKGDATWGASLDALAALARAGALADDADRARVAGLLRSQAAERLGAVGCRLLVQCGTEADVDRLCESLVGATGAIAAALAEALASHASCSGAIVEAATREPALYPSAARAVAAAGSEDLLARLVALPGPSPEARATAVASASASFPSAALIRVARHARDPEIHEALLMRLAEHGPQLPEHANSGDAQAVREGLEMLAMSRLKRGRAEAALAAINDIVVTDDPAAALRLRRLRVHALVACDRVDDAVSLGASAQDWIEALAMVTSEPHGRRVLRQVRISFGSALTPEQADEVDRLAALILRPRFAPAEEPTR